jgi:2-oxo-3-hexenedioate decarboxylase
MMYAPVPDADDEAEARRLLDIAAATGSCAPFTDQDEDFDLGRAYRVQAAIRAARVARGERPSGWKIGFTNRTIWREYNVHAPIWGPVFDTTVGEVPEDEAATFDAGVLMEPRIEPEIVFRIGAPLRAGMDEEMLLDAIDGVALGFELVQSPYPDWRFKAPDTVAAFALHGRLFHRPFAKIEDGNRSMWLDKLSDFALALHRDGKKMDDGRSRNVLGGPLSALKAMVEGLPATALAVEIGPGEVVTTGTLTRALPVASGESWETRVAGLPLADMALRLAD